MVFCLPRTLTPYFQENIVLFVHFLAIFEKRDSFYMVHTYIGVKLHHNGLIDVLL